MSLTTPQLALGLLFSLTALNAQAALTSYYTAVGNIPVVYSSVSNVTWTQDANLFKTLYDANNNLVNLITIVTPSYSDPSWGLQVIGDVGGAVDDFDTSTGRLSWWGGIAFTNYLNSINYAGSNQWRLPTSNAIFNYNGTAGNELGQLFYRELGGRAGYTIPNTANFTNEQAYVYWSDTEYATDPFIAWYFDTTNGYQDHDFKHRQVYAWAVSPGRVSAVPVPGAVWLMGTGLVGLLGLKRRGHAG
ncbi:MAG: hypothetical protein BVN35_14025 [Proteobacteria bacterium ST_bin11]|nr:MAG: hypothetical protein BVN35_14025 [Proteobacteria bacterium ST_bin11]